MWSEAFLKETVHQDGQRLTLALCGVDVSHMAECCNGKRLGIVGRWYAINSLSVETNYDIHCVVFLSQRDGEPAEHKGWWEHRWAVKYTLQHRVYVWLGRQVRHHNLLLCNGRNCQQTGCVCLSQWTL